GGRDCAAARAARDRDRAPCRRERHALWIRHLRRHRARLAREGFRDRQAQDSTPRSIEDAWRDDGAREDPSRRDRASESQGRGGTTLTISRLCDLGFDDLVIRRLW